MIDFNDPILHRGDLLFSYDKKRYDPAKATLLIYASCHGRTLIRYFTYHRPDICEKYNLLRLETAPITLAIREGIDVFNHPTIKAIFSSAEVVATYNMGARMGHHELAKVSRLFRPGARVITFVAPNFSGFCPFSYDGYGSHLGLLNMFDRGISAEHAWVKFLGGDFDPLFPVRWRLEIGRHQDKESYHDIGLTRFIIEHHKKAKLWTGPAHPTYHVMAYLGSEIGGLLGFPKHTDEQILAFDHALEMISGQPETSYEFDYYKFDYPKRYEDGKENYYHKALQAIHQHWQTGGSIRPSVD